MNRRPAGPRVLIIAGVLTAVLGLLAFVGGFVMLGTNFAAMMGEATNPEESLAVSTAIPGTTTADLEPGRYQVVALGSNLVIRSGVSTNPGGYTLNRAPFSDPDVTVTGPNGVAVTLEPPQFQRLSSLPTLDQVGFAEFAVIEAGGYTLEATNAPGQVTKVGIADAKSMTEEATPWLASSGVIVLGGVLLPLGLLVVVGGIVWRVVSGSAARRNANPPHQPWQV